MASTQLTWKTNGKKVEADCLSPLSLKDPEWLSLVDSLEFFGANTNLDKLSFKRIGVIEPPEYNYTFSTTDNRKWKQRLVFDTPANPAMTFDVVDLFRLSEFQPQRDVRLAISVLVATHGLQTLTVNWA